MAKQLLVAQNRVFDLDGTPAGDALVYYYRTGTTTLVTLYANSAKSASLANPVQADAFGYVPEVWYDDTFEVRKVIKNASGDTIEDMDPVPRVSAAADAAASVTFAPITGNPADDVQEAIANLQSEVLGVGSRFCTYGGTANAITLTSAAGEAYSALSNGLTVRFIPTTTNTATFTINLDGLGAVNARTVTGAIAPSGYLIANEIVEATYDGTQWIVSRRPERFTSADGTCTRMADGVMIAYFSGTSSGSGAATWSYPLAFSNQPEVSVTPVSGSVRIGQLDSRSTAAATYSTYDTSSARQSTPTSLMAVGRWY